ncbi:hypothetical protein SLEP1_g7347 [Rubroshorea leprosula]|uniref:Uncharacterized protein n=1 Tax=Rubroshorea leprosula TaxID=152421 RepID=A0AAV5I6E0_9ROSI|nr:hypothetical protein SLEP1_g7347 [Rubroshorea leprosula]
MSIRERKPERNPNPHTSFPPVGLRPPRIPQTQTERPPVKEGQTQKPQPFHYPSRSRLQGLERTEREDRFRGLRRPFFGYGKGVLERATPFFFTNFPEDWEMGEMWKVFIKVGRVIQVFIARKRDFKGRRFGFVKFLEVKDSKAVENQLNRITIDHHTLQANLARFSKDEAQRKKETSKVHNKMHVGITGSSGMQRRGTRTYAEVVRSGQRKMMSKERPSREWKRKDQEGAKKIEREGWYGLEVGVDDEDIRELEKCFIGHAKCPEIISTLQDKFAMEGYFSAKITPMGSNLVLLSSGDAEELKHLVTEGSEWLAQWFTEVTPWSPEVESWNQWEVAEDEKVIEHGNKDEQSWSPETSSAAMEFEFGPETLEKSDRAINEERQTSNQQGVEGPEENDMMNCWETESEANEGQTQSIEEKEGGKRADEDPYPPGFDPKQRALGLTKEDEPTKQTKESKMVEPHEQMTFNSRVDEGKEREAVEHSYIQGEYDKGTEDLIHGKKMSQARKEQNMEEDSIEEERRTNPFWEGLASDDEILQSKMERIARQRKMGKKKGKQRRLTTRRKAHSNLELDLHLRKRRLIAEGEFQMEKGVSRAYQGLGKSSKRRAVRELIRKEKVEMIFLQETKLEQINDKLVYSIWGSENCEWLMKAAQGSAGGILSIWNPKFFRMHKKLEGTGFCGMTGFWGVDQIPCSFGNIYSSCNRQEKWQMWSELQELIKAAGGGNWCLAGDFNAIRCKEEKKGKTYDTSDMCKFNNFISETGLLEIPLKGRKFTWYKPDGSAMSKLDRFLLSNELLLCFPDISMRGLSRDISDHCPIVLETCAIDWGPKPFCSLDCWWNHEGFANFIQEKWTNMSVYGWGCYKLKEKFKRLKVELKRWNREEVKRHIKDYFKKKFEEERWERPEFVLDSFRKLSTEENNFLEAAFSEQEIQEAVLGCNDSKSPGPDGFNFNFLKKMWPILKKDLYEEGRQITDGIIIPNEVVHEAKSNKKPVLIFKADFEKAYDSVNWKFLDSMMSKFGFRPKWRSWIRECISSATVSILVNGSPTKEFQMEKGLRQGDPLAPFIFLMIVEAPNGLMLKAAEENLFQGVEIDRSSLTLMHLQYADDSIFFCEANEQNVMVLKSILRSFEMISGLKVNFFKSSLVGLNVDKVNLEDYAEKLNCATGKVPFKYLGVLIGSNPRRMSTWAPVIEIMKRRLSNWKRDSLSFGGRMILLNSVLSSILVYYFSTLKAPKQVLEAKYKIDKREAWEANKWDRLGSAWWGDLWKIEFEVDGKRGWFKEGVGKIVREGKETLFWHEVWAGDMPLKEKFNRLFSLSREKDVCVADMGEWKKGEWTWNWKWRRRLFTWETDMLQDLLTTAQGTKLKQGEDDCYEWKHDPIGKYSVRSAYNLLNQKQDGSPDHKYKLIWDSKILLKISAFAWRALQNRIPTKENLLKRGMIEETTGTKCTLCGEKIETASHILFSCLVSWKVWCLCYDWWGIKTATQEDGWNHLRQHMGLISIGRTKQAWSTIWFFSVWSIWLWRNALIFKGETQRIEQVIDHIKAHSYTWIKARLTPDLPHSIWFNSPKEACRILAK